MPLPVPKLDVRTWSELVSEGRSLIPRTATRWTDHNVHDPGITLMELLAWISEMLLFRMDRVDPATLRGFLRLVGVVVEPAGVAESVIAVAGSGEVIPAGAQITDVGETVVFEGSDPLTISPAWLGLKGEPGGPRGEVWTHAGAARIDRTAENDPLGRGFLPLGAEPRIGDALELLFDVLPAQPGSPLSLYVWTPGWEADGTRARRIAAEEAASRADCPPRPRDSWPTRDRCERAEEGSEPPPARTTDNPRFPGATTAWEYRATSGEWLPMRVDADQTRALAMSGRILVTLPADAINDRAWAHVGERYWLRCRLASGAYDCPPRLLACVTNAIRVRHAARVRAVSRIGVSDGHAAQEYALPDAPIVAGSTRLRLTTSGNVDTAWREVADWDASASADRHYLLNPRTGHVAFGNGLVGSVPPEGTIVESLEYAVGSGSGGNVSARRLSCFLDPTLSSLRPLQPFPARGGSDAEPLARAHGRALDSVADPGRAVTARDFERLAVETPSVHVGRARAWPGYHPTYPCFAASGVVTVVVLPGCGRRPTPTAAFLDTVRAYLERRRTVATELCVVGPTYVKVTVSATLHVDRGVDRSITADLAQRALDEFFHPLHGGPGQEGWPFGRDVHATEILSLLASVRGVQHVDELDLSGGSEMRCVSLPLCPLELVDSQRHRIKVVEA